MRSQEQIEADAEANRNRLLAAESLALLLLLRRRDEAVQRGLTANRSLGFTAALIESAVRDSITESRALSRAAGISRLRAEATAIGFGLGHGFSELSERARDAVRARLYASSYARHWLAKANGSGLKLDPASAAANAATKPRLQTVAISESSEAFNRGRRRVVEEVRSVELLRVWDAQLDRRTCPLCAGLDGTIVGIRDNFPSGEPGSLHPRDRCTWSLIGTSERYSLKKAA